MKNKILLLGLMAMQVHLAAQTLHYRRDHIGGTSVSRTVDMKRFGNEHYLLAEAFNISGTTEPVIVKLGASGAPLWMKKISDTLTITPNALAITAAGELAVLCQHPNQNVSPYDEAVLIRLDSSGQFISSTRYDTTSTWKPGRIDTVSGGGFIISGTRSVSNFFKAPTLIRTDASGNMLWAKQYVIDNLGQAPVNSLLACSDGGFLFGGYSVSGGYLLKTDYSGNTEWVNFYTGNGHYTDLLSLSETPGGYVAAGWRGPYVFVVRIASDGSLIWSTSYQHNWSGANDAQARKIMMHPSGGYAVLCEYSNDSITPNTKIESWWMHLDTSGQIISSKKYQTADFGAPHVAMELTGNTNFLLAGDGFYDLFTIASCHDLVLVQTDLTGADSCLAQPLSLTLQSVSEMLPAFDTSFAFTGTTAMNFSTTTASYTGGVFCMSNPLSLNEISEQNISIFPNPADDYFFIRSDNTSPATISITDCAGRILRNKTIQQNEEIYSGDLTSGIYFIRISTKNKTSVHRLVIR